MSATIDDIEKAQAQEGLPEFAPGDRVRVHFLVIEGNRRRPQVFEGVVIKRQGSGIRETFTVRKQSFGVGVERTFPLHSPKIEKLEVASRGRVRRAKLYYLRGRTGKAARVAERRWGIDEEVIAAGSEGAVDASGESLPPEEVPEPVEAEGEEAVEGDAEGQGAPEGEAPPPEAEASDEAPAAEAPEGEQANGEEGGAEQEASPEPAEEVGDDSGQAPEEDGNRD